MTTTTCRVQTCRGGCNRTLVPHGVWTRQTETERQAAEAAGKTPHASRGLCRMCQRRAAKAGTLIDFERLTMSRAEVLAEWDVLRGEGYSIRQAAERLGMTRDALDKALERARAAGVAA